jgi:RecA/RadA recombinase
MLDEEKPFVYILDSLDHISSKDELEKTQEQRTAHRKGKDAAGSYGMSKQKYLKKMFKEISCELMKTDSILCIVSQTIANIGSMFNPKARAGGSGLDFTARIIPWLSVMEADKINNRVVGRKVKCNIKKNHITYTKREIQFWVYDNLGVDDTKTSIEFLVKEQVWPKHGGWIIPEGLFDGDEKYQMKDLIKLIERRNLEEELSRLVGQTWLGIEETLKPDRKRRYE